MIYLQTITKTTSQAIGSIRQFSAVDNAVTLFMQAIDAVSRRVYGPLFDENSLKTYKQIQREEELARMKASVAKDSACHNFCTVTALFIDETAKQIFAENLNLLPRKFEDWTHFKICLGLPYYTGYLVEYAYIQMQRRQDVRGDLLESTTGKSLQRLYGRCRLKIADSLLDKAVVEVFVSFEHALWKLCLWAKSLESEDKTRKPIPRLVSSILHSLAPLLSSQTSTLESFKAQAKIDPLSREEQLICCIVDCKRKNLLPPNLPDPDSVRLDVANLHQELDKALHNYLKNVIDKLLDKHVSLKGVSKVLYTLEGKHFLKETVTSLLVESVFEQILDPDQFAILLLSGARIETMPIEKQGFGPQGPKFIWTHGKAILDYMQKPKANPAIAIKAYEDLKLRYNPRSRRQIQGRLETKKQLKSLVSGIIRKLFDKRPKDRSGSNGITTESLRKAVGDLPYVGPITKGLRFGFNAAYFSVQYFLSEAEKEEGFWLWLTKELSGDPLFDHIAEKIVELLYHPVYRIAILQALHTIIEKEVSEKEDPNAGTNIRHNFKTVATFLFSHIAPPSMQQSVGKWATHFTGDKAFQAFAEKITTPPEEPVLEKRLPLIQSIVEEYLLYVRLTQTMRKKGVEFEGDAKFWEFYIREYLNKHMAQNKEKEDAREKKVQFLASCAPDALVYVLTQPP